ncbi:Cell wall galactomannoprotein [Niveomyces insectorum RCEF 264]|uniref:Cell wall galactomannoprotein n=1 Tax=Niveomyces insectorum RCEF 264 TaxID=1081102 RepID=A0A167Z161_9HYPO|nr:Cell wall galactomannoprotein [Niveomyces insectorum RCEF 264]
MRVSTLLRVVVLALPGCAVASGATIVQALNNVNTKTQSLEQTVQSWSGDLLGSLSIVAESASVLQAICAGRDAAQASAELTVDEALSIATAVETLATTVNATMTAIIDAHAKFADILEAPVVLLDLKAQKSASDAMSSAIVAKVPASLQAIAQSLVAPIDESFALAIDAFSVSKGI